MTGSPQEPREYDVVVVGGGPTGENVADRVKQAGLSTVLVEAELVGGECSYWACIPSKSLLRPVVALHESRAVEGAKQAVTGSIDVSAVFARRDYMVSSWSDDGQVSWLDSAGIDLVRGHGRLTGERSVTVTDSDGVVTHLTARHAVVLATGTSAVIPPIPGLAEARPWTSREATSAKEAPARLAVLGGGVVGCEMAAAYAGLGSSVTLLIRDARPLARNDDFAGDLVASGLEAAGVDVRTSTGVESVRRGEDDVVSVKLHNGETIEADEILVAAGRAPKTSDLGLETVGMKPGSWLDVDDTLRVSGVDWLYATGDLNHRALMTHMGKYQGRAAAAAIAARARGESVEPTPWAAHSATADHAAVPQVVFTIPEVATVGRTEAEARAAGLNVRAVDFEIGSVSGGYLYADDYQGHARMVVDTDRRVVVGVTLVGLGVAELIHSATVAVVGEVPLDRLWHAVPSFPTISEIWLRLLETYGL